MDKLEVQLQNMGFSEEEAAHFRKLADAGACSCPERLRILTDKRKETLDEVHRLEEQITDMDILRQEIRKKS